VYRHLLLPRTCRLLHQKFPHRRSNQLTTEQNFSRNLGAQSPQPKGGPLRIRQPRRILGQEAIHLCPKLQFPNQISGARRARLKRSQNQRG
jgi:hypothetical protein